MLIDTDVDDIEPPANLEELIVVEQRERRESQRLSASLDLSNAKNRTHNGVATAFIDRNLHLLRYVPTWKKWLVWDGTRWRIDDDNSTVTELGRKYADSLWFELRNHSSDPKILATAATFVRSANQRHGIESFINLARCDQSIVVRHDQLNQSTTMLNVRNGTIDLESGKLLPHCQDDHITQLANVSFDEQAKATKWLESLTMIFAGDNELIRYVRQLLGYSISGDSGEAILPICYGGGANGKSTIWNTIIDLLGDYGFLAPSSLLIGSTSQHPTEVASLYQRRFVAISEPEQSARLREARVKELTGDSTITARRCKEDFWSFNRTHKFWLSSNHLPQINGNDDGIWRRVKLIPFTVDLRTVTTPIPDYHRWLVNNEGPGILNWLMAGYRDYRANGFVEPESVRNATGGYRDQSDSLGQFIADRCVVEPSAVVSSNELFRAYEEWGGQLTQTKFSLDMAIRFEKKLRTFGPYRNKQVFEGIGLQIDADY